jgi:hypothetical protein
MSLEDFKGFEVTPKGKDMVRVLIWLDELEAAHGEFIFSLVEMNAATLGYRLVKEDEAMIHVFKPCSNLNLSSDDTIKCELELGHTGEHVKVLRWKQ